MPLKINNLNCFCLNLFSLGNNKGRSYVTYIRYHLTTKELLLITIGDMTCDILTSIHGKLCARCNSNKRPKLRGEFIEVKLYFETHCSLTVTTDFGLCQV